MQTRCLEPFRSFAHPAWTCPWVLAKGLAPLGREHRVEQPLCNLHSVPWTEALFQLCGPAGFLQGSLPAWHGMSTGDPQHVYLHASADLFEWWPGQNSRCWVPRAMRERLSSPGPHSLADRSPVCNVISIAILSLGTLTTRWSLTAPVICLSQQAARRNGVIRPGLSVTEGRGRVALFQRTPT